MNLYLERGVSAQKEDVHNAIKHLDKGLFPYAFCKLYPDYLTGNDEFVSYSHSDGAGTKSILAYIYWKETGDLSVWKSVAQDAIVMNLDDLACCGIFENFIFSSIIDRNKKRIPGEVIEAVIEGNKSFIDSLKDMGISIHYVGGETADVGDIVRTIAINGTVSGLWKKNRIITNEKIEEGNVIVGVGSSGKAIYEKDYNSGIGSNGLTNARHDVLNSGYKTNFPETFDDNIPENLVYSGKYQITEKIKSEEFSDNISIGNLLLSPTRTYLPFIQQILSNHFDEIFGMVHCTGGGQTKCLKYLNKPLRIIKDNLFPTPLIFQLIQASSSQSLREMYEVFNMGHRLEIFTSKVASEHFIKIASTLGLEAKVIGYVEKSEKKELVIKTDSTQLIYL